MCETERGGDGAWWGGGAVGKVRRMMESGRDGEAQWNVEPKPHLTV